ncbi:hypothetical protein CPB83DRAFT_638325 [Crepidotus variabilis]|uniref:Uncharacterized protein n=1 Tax=Crepidotus variabilis TaxID=179855 RepID=A0A9P6E857_9AGAR|nr:hypothetical protein CPB83DRAFT_638325 [Crepidotus variabilis]
MKRLGFFFNKDTGSQSMRAGGATNLAEHGVPPSIIQASGRWSSENHQCYYLVFYLTAHTHTYTKAEVDIHFTARAVNASQSTSFSN